VSCAGSPSGLSLFPAAGGESPMSCPKVYGVVAKREGSWWVLAIDSLGIAGQVRHLDEGESVGRDLIAAFLDVPGEQVSVELEVILPEEAATALAEATREEEIARTAFAAAVAKRRSALAALRRAGMSQSEVARALGLTPQGLSQFVKEDGAGL